MHAYVKSIDENAEYMEMEIHCFLKKLSTLNFPHLRVVGCYESHKRREQTFSSTIPHTRSALCRLIKIGMMRDFYGFFGNIKFLCREQISVC